LRTVKNPRAAAERLRAATQSLRDPQDVEAVAQYLRELEDLAREQETSIVGRGSSKAPLTAGVRLPSGDNEAETQIRPTVVPLQDRRSRALRKASPSDERAGNWVLRLSEPCRSDPSAWPISTWIAAGKTTRNSQASARALSIGSRMTTLAP
jgi:hypothetical protein